MNHLSPFSRYLVLTFALGSLVFDGFELGLMPVASLSVSKSLLGDTFTPQAGGEWFALFTASMMTGAALGGIFLGRLGDLLGRSKAMGISILFYSSFAGLGAYVENQYQMLILRFLVGLGVGGVWPNAVALTQECWPDKSKALVAGLLGAALNSGILLLSQIAQITPITPESWRWLFHLAGAPALLGLFTIFFLPESPMWLAARNKHKQEAMTKMSDNHESNNLLTLFKPPLLKITLMGILLGSIPLVGAWSASKWMIPWSDAVSKNINPEYKALIQGYWATGAVLGSFCGAQVASFLGRKLSYFVISLGATALTLYMFLGSAPLKPEFPYVVLLQAFVTTLFFGWLPLYLPQMFPTEYRATGTGISYNFGRFATAIGIFAATALFQYFQGDYAKVGATCSLVYTLGVFAILLLPSTPKASNR